MENIKIRYVLNNRDGSIAFVEFTQNRKNKILSKKNFEKRFEIELESEVEKFAS